MRSALERGGIRDANELERLLVPDALRDALAPHLDGPAAKLERVCPTYVRAKRDVSALLALELEWRDGGTSRSTLGSLYVSDRRQVGGAADKARSLRRLEPAVGPAMAVIEEPQALFLAFPNDRELRGLPAAADARRLKNRLHRLGHPFSATELRIRKDESRIAVVRWKPNRRALLCAELACIDTPTGRREGRTLYVRVVPAREISRAAARWRAAGRLRGLRVPQVVAIDVERSFLALESVPGTALARALETRSLQMEPLEQSGLAAALRALYGPAHATADLLPWRGDEDELEAALRVLDDAASWAPMLDGARSRLKALLVSRQAELDPLDPCVVHGDLTADQILEDSATCALIDWDEASRGDPHADLASLAVDTEIRTGDAAWADRVQRLAREVLDERWQEDRWSWHLALAWSKRAMATLQRGERDWIADAQTRLERALAWVERPLVSPPPRRASRERGGDAVTSALRRLLNPATRAQVAGAAGLSLTAVWPEPGGAIARLERVAPARGNTVWLRLGLAVEAWTFPDDPALPTLRERIENQGYVAAGHRLGRRAALRSPDRADYLHMRSGGPNLRRLERLRRVHEAVAQSAVTVPALRGWVADGWHASAMPGRSLDVARAPFEVWEALGRTLARVHRTAAPSELDWRGAGAAREATLRQIRLAARAGGPFGAWIETRYEQTERGAIGERGGRASLVHGDLHPAQIVVGPRLVLLDWEQAHVGAPEEDLGNLAAHVAWASNGAAQDAWGLLARAYQDEGGWIDPACFAFHTRLALLRVLAIHSWRDASRRRALATEAWDRRLEECTEW